MSFSNMMDILQEKDKEKIVFVKSGVFYIAVGRYIIFLIILTLVNLCFYLTFLLTIK